MLAGEKRLESGREGGRERERESERLRERESERKLRFFAGCDQPHILDFTRLAMVEGRRVERVSER
jgi:hypothetical protein